MRSKVKIFLIVLSGIFIFVISPVGKMIITISTHYLAECFIKNQMIPTKYLDSSRYDFEAFNSSIAYHEYYFESDKNKYFENNKSYHKISANEIKFLTNIINQHKINIAKFDSNISWYSFDIKTQIKENDLVYVNYKNEYFFTVYYYDVNKNILYYFMIKLDK